MSAERSAGSAPSGRDSGGGRDGGGRERRGPRRQRDEAWLAELRGAGTKTERLPKADGGKDRSGSPTVRIPRPGVGKAGSTGGTGTGEAAKPRPRRQSHPALRRFAPWLLALVFFCCYLVLSVARFERFGSMSWDLGIFEEGVRNYAHFRAPVADIKGPGFDLLGDHFSPILAVLAPFYAVIPSALTLLTAQALLFALSVVPVTRIARDRLGLARGLGIGIAYGLSWGLQRAVDFDFHEMCFAVPLLALVLEKLLRGRWRAAAWWALPLVLVKEDMGLTVAAVGCYLLVTRRRRETWKVGATLTVFGCGAFAATVGLIMPALNSGDRYDYWTKLVQGGTPPAQGGPHIDLGHLLRELPNHLVSPEHTKAWTLFALLGVTWFLALRSPLLIIALPTIIWRFVSREPNYWGTLWHYNAILMPILFVGLVDALTRMRGGPRPWVHRVANGAVPAVMATAIVLCGHLPFADLVHHSTYDGGAKAAAARRALKVIPDGVTVESDVLLLNHLTSRDTVYWFGDTGKLDPDYVAQDLSGNPSLAGSPEQLANYVYRLHPGASYQVAFDEQGIVVWKLLH